MLWNIGKKDARPKHSISVREKCKNVDWWTVGYLEWLSAVWFQKRRACLREGVLIGAVVLAAAPDGAHQGDRPA